jgi:hypothetical protein
MVRRTNVTYATLLSVIILQIAIFRNAITRRSIDLKQSNARFRKTSPLNGSASIQGGDVLQSSRPQPRRGNLVEHSVSTR